MLLKQLTLSSCIVAYLIIIIVEIDSNLSLLLRERYTLQTRYGVRVK